MNLAEIMLKQSEIIKEQQDIIDRLYILLSLGASGVDDVTLGKMRDAALNAMKLT